jgi:hypothetical protein
MIVLLLGAPESGKTTQASRLKTALGLTQLHIDDVARGARSSTDLSAAVAAAAAGCKMGMTLEGFPNTLAEAQALDDALSSNGMKVSTVIYIDVGENEWLEKADPVLSLYYDRGILASVDGRPFEEAVAEQIMDAMASARGIAQAKEDKSAYAPPPAAETKASKERTEFLDQVTSVKWIDPRRGVGGFTIGCSVSLIPTHEKSKNFQSNSRFRADMHRHERLKLDPCDRFPAPVIASMEFGWDCKRPGWRVCVCDCIQFLWYTNRTALLCVCRIHFYHHADILILLQTSYETPSNHIPPLILQTGPFPDDHFLTIDALYSDSSQAELYKKDPDLFHPRMKSRETLYAEALILGPRHP